MKKIKEVKKLEIGEVTDDQFTRLIVQIIDGTDDCNFERTFRLVNDIYHKWVARNSKKEVSDGKNQRKKDK